jgi:hypothetical protein
MRGHETKLMPDSFKRNQKIMRNQGIHPGYGALPDGNPGAAQHHRATVALPSLMSLSLYFATSTAFFSSSS